MAGSALPKSMNKVDGLNTRTDNNTHISTKKDHASLTTTFNIRGTRFETLTANLIRFPESLLANLDMTSPYYVTDKKEYFFDRDVQVFNSILNLLSTGQLHVAKHVCVQLLRDEMAFWGIPDYCIAQCCWRDFYQLDEYVEILKNLKSAHKYEIPSSDGCLENINELSLRQRVWMALDQPASSTLAKVWHCFYLSCVLVTSCILCLWTMEEFRTDHYLSIVDESEFEKLKQLNKSKLSTFVLGDPILPLLVLDVFCLVIFTLELIVHFVVCQEKARFLKSPLNIVSLVVIISMWLAFCFEFKKPWMANNYAALMLYFFCKAITAMRLLLFIRLEKIYGALRVLIMSIKSSVVELTLMAITFMITTVIFASLMFFAEVETEDGIHSIFIAMWWAFITMTTVGYGDYYPKSSLGYIVGVTCAFCGLMLLAMPIAVIASNFSEYYKQHKDLQRVIAMKKERNCLHKKYCSSIDDKNEEIKTIKCKYTFQVPPVVQELC